MKHKHHIIPKHEGGSDFSENIVELTVTQHAMWHYAEWRRKGLWQDKIAWQGLAGIIGHEDAVKEAVIQGARAPKPNRKSSTPEGNEKRRQAMLGLKRTEEDKEKKRVAALKRWAKPEARDFLYKEKMWRARFEGIEWTRRTASELAERYNVTSRCIRQWRRRLR